MNRRLFIASTGAAVSALAQQANGIDEARRVETQRRVAAQVARQDFAVIDAVTPRPKIQPVLTRSGGNLRQCAYLNETKLTPASVVSNPPRLLYTLRGVGDPRIEAQPLLVPDVQIEDGSVHDLCITADMSNHVCAYDANDGTLLWMRRLGQPVHGGTSIDSYNINPQWGILSTPVIDSGVIYAVAWVSPDGTPASSRFFLHALSLRDGLPIHAPLALTTVNATVQRKQRAALTLATLGGRRTVLIPWATIQESSPSAHGYITAVDVSDWRVRAEINLSVDGQGAGVWQGGQGLLVDGENIYALTSNGTFDAGGSLSESFIKLRYDYPSAGMTVTNWFTPFLDKARGGGGWEDMDFGAAGPAIIPELNIAVLSGKDGIAYTVPLDAIGKTNLADFVNGVNHKSFRQALFYTYYAAGKDPVPASAADLNFFYANRTHNLHSGSVIFKSDNGWRTYCFGENGNARAWSIDASGLKYLASGAEQASAQSPVGNGNHGGMTGGMTCLSANGTKDALLWAVCPDGDANKIITTGRLLCYDALNFSKYADGSGQMKTLWRSNSLTFSKFNTPVVSGGRVWVPCYDGKILVFG